MEQRSFWWHILRLGCVLSCVPGIATGNSVPDCAQVGSNITRCDMKCPDNFPVLLLSRRCGEEEEERLLQIVCHISRTERFHPRFHLDISSGCWTLPQAGRGDSCVYEVRDRGTGDKVLSSTSIRVLDPVLIYNISSNSSRLGEDIAVTVQFSREESNVTWELDGGRLPERYRLIDDNRTLIIPSVQRDDAERTFRVRVTNPVSEEVQDYRLEVREPERSLWMRGISVAAAVAIILLVGVMICIRYRKCHQTMANGDVENPARRGLVSVNHSNDSHRTENSCTPPGGEESVQTAEKGSSPVTANGYTPVAQDDCTQKAENGSTPVTSNCCAPVAQNDSAPITRL
ncbi:uncharacterized protein [Hyperolius riggenbachi]|uniref:uncharacterized protein n=1 Tax=Hyperolius riggenbachi TaxID=752182 RepID=UPI0035A32C94